MGLLVSTILFAQETLPSRATDSSTTSNMANYGMYAVIALIIKSIAEPIASAWQSHKQRLELNAVGKVQGDLVKALANCDMLQGDLKEIHARYEEMKADRDEQRHKADTYFDSFQSARVELARLQ